MRVNNNAWEILKDIQGLSDLIERDSSMIYPLSISGPLSVICGDGIEDDGGFSALSILEGTISTMTTSLRVEEARADEILTAEISRREDNVSYIMKEIVTKSMEITDLDIAYWNDSGETGNIIDDYGESQDNDYWAGRAHRRSEANRPRGRLPRIINQSSILMMDKENKESQLPPQRLRSLSDRRTSPTVLGASMSSSYEGPAFRASMGGESEMATVETYSDDGEDSLSLPLAFVECTPGESTMKVDTRMEILQTPRVKGRRVDLQE